MGNGVTRSINIVNYFISTKLPPEAIQHSAMSVRCVSSRSTSQFFLNNSAPAQRGSIIKRRLVDDFLRYIAET